MQDVKLFTIKVEKMGRKWIQAKIQGKDYWFGGQVLINEFTKNFKEDEVHQLYGILDNKGNSYGAKFELTPVGLTEEEFMNYRKAEEMKYKAEQAKAAEEKAIYWIRKNFKDNGYIYKNGVDTLREIGVYVKYNAEIRDMEREIDAKRKASIISRMQENRATVTDKDDNYIKLKLPNRLAIGSLMYRGDRALKVVNSSKVDADDEGNLSYWESNYHQDYFYRTNCEDVSNTKVGNDFIEKNKAELAKLAEEKVRKQERTKIIEQIKHVLKEMGKYPKSIETTGNIVFTNKQNYGGISILADIPNNLVYYVEHEGIYGDSMYLGNSDGGLGRTWVAPANGQLRALIDKLEKHSA